MRIQLKVQLFFAITFVWLILACAVYLGINLILPTNSDINLLIATIIVLSTTLLFIFSWLLYVYLMKFSLNVYDLDDEHLNEITGKRTKSIKKFILTKANIIAKKYEFFYEIGEKLIADTKRHECLLALFMIEFDINPITKNKNVDKDENKVMEEFSNKISTLLRAGDVVAHVEKNSFIILLTDTKQPKFVAPIAEKLLQVCEMLMEKYDTKFIANMNIGIAIYPNDAETINDLHQKAQIALYKAKQTDAWSYYFYKEDLNKIAQEHIKLKKILQRAIKNNELILHYQPQLSLKTEIVERVEALVRLNDLKLGNISPNVLIPLAEEIGMFADIGTWVINEACLHCKQWQDQGFKLMSICVNVSNKQFYDENLISIIKHALKKSGLPPRSLEVEITETVIMNDIKYAIDKLKQLHDIGVRIAIDDFGTGYTSINYLKQLPVSILKIDKSFIKDIPYNKDDIAITNAMITLSHNLGIEVVAEGVERDDQLNCLKEMGCDLIQGYIFSSPIADKELIKFLSKKNNTKVTT